MIRIDRRRGSKSAEINIAPLLDLVFILLIFFMVTTHFSRDEGLEIEKPTANSAAVQPAEALLLSIARDGGLHMGGHRISLQEVASSVRRALAAAPRTPLLLVADRSTSAQQLIEVYDRCKEAGAERIAVATSKP
ncbi:MAG: biopolymer transporter ExbD [Planctomycetes bacterium]|nr:biopolymer transporter ExbD [Planctomycetota bacterium]